MPLLLSRPASPTHSSVIINLNTPPLPTREFDRTQSPTPSSVMRATAPAFQPIQQTPPRSAHTRTQSELLPPISISPSTTHRRAVSITQLASPSISPAGTGGIPLPRRTTDGKTRVMGMPTLAEITAHYRSMGRKPSIKDLSSLTKDPSTPAAAAAAASPFSKAHPEKRYSLDSVGSGTSGRSWSSDSTASTAEDDEPRTPPDMRPRASSTSTSGSQSRLPSFLRARSGSGGDRNPLAEALAKHRHPSLTPSPPAEREGKRIGGKCETPRVQVTPPSTTMDSPPSFPCRRGDDSYFPSPANVSRRPTTSALTTDVPGFSLTPPTAAGQGVSPLKVLEAQVEDVRRRKERAERMVKLLGKRTGVAV